MMIYALMSNPTSEVISLYNTLHSNVWVSVLNNVLYDNKSLRISKDEQPLMAFSLSHKLAIQVQANDLLKWARVLVLVFQFESRWSSICILKPAFYYIAREFF